MRRIIVGAFHNKGPDGECADDPPKESPKSVDKQKDTLKDVTENELKGLLPSSRKKR